MIESMSLLYSAVTLLSHIVLKDFPVGQLNVIVAYDPDTPKTDTILLPLSSYRS